MVPLQNFPKKLCKSRFSLHKQQSFGVHDNFFLPVIDACDFGNDIHTRTYSRFDQGSCQLLTIFHRTGCKGYCIFHHENKLKSNLYSDFCRYSNQSFHMKRNETETEEFVVERK
jgi:hypothetical protein